MAPKSTKKVPAHRGRTPAPENETTHDTFVRIGRPRLRNAIKAIRLVGNLSAYQPTAGEIVFINEGLMSAVEHAMARFRKESAPNLEETFDLARVADTASGE